MSIVEMKKLVVVGHGETRRPLLKAFHRLGCVEVITTNEFENTYHKEDVVSKDAISNKLLRLSFAFSYLRAQKQTAAKLAKKELIVYEPTKTPFIKPTPRFAFDTFNEIADREDGIFAELSELEAYSVRTNDIKNEITKLKNLYEQVSTYAPITCKLSAFADTPHTAIALGVIPRNKSEELEKLKNEFDKLFIFYDVSAEKKLMPVVTVCLKEDRDAVFARLNELEYVRCSYTYDDTATAKLEEIVAEVKALEDEKVELMFKSLAKESSLDNFKQLYDYYLIENAKQSASDGCALTGKAYVMSAWIPKEAEQRVTEAIAAVSENIVVETAEPAEDEIIPTFIKSHKIVAPYEAVTNMYSVPSVRDVDPNPFVAFFYFILFGMMMGDAGYGLLLAIGGFTMYKLMKPVPGKGQLLLIIGMGGVSTFIWGILFGGWFAVDIAEGSLLDKITWFNPLDEPLTMLILSLAMGVIHILCGIAIKGYQLFKKKDWQGALADCVSWYLVFIGLGIYILGSMLVHNAALGKVGIGCAVAGVACLLIFGGAGKKGFKRVIGGVPKLYDTVNLMSDILSYSRLFGLGLATGVVGMVVNKICEVIVGMLPEIAGVPILGLIIAAPIFIGGHLFNIAINTLGTYVHNCRLQYIEFFGKFYEGAGHQFLPLGTNTKYTYIER